MGVIGKDSAPVYQSAGSLPEPTRKHDCWSFLRTNLFSLQIATCFRATENPTKKFS